MRKQLAHDQAAFNGVKASSVSSINKKVNREAVVVTGTVHPLVELDQLARGGGIVIVDPIGEGLTPLDPGLLVGCRLDEDVRPLVGSDHPFNRISRQLTLGGVELVLRRTLGRAEVVDGVVLSEPAEPDVDVAVDGDGLVQVEVVVAISEGIDVAVQDQPSEMGRE